VVQAVPSEFRWLFWEVDVEAIDLTRDADFVLARVLESGTLAAVRWVIGLYGLERIHRLFREVGHPDLSERTIQFWRAALHAEDEPWATPPPWRKSSGAPWVA
jgi:hypothetical protein